MVGDVAEGAEPGHDHGREDREPLAFAEALRVADEENQRNRDRNDRKTDQVEQKADDDPLRFSPVLVVVPEPGQPRE